MHCDLCKYRHLQLSTASPILKAYLLLLMLPTMKKSDKKTENSIREALTAVCELALEDIAGFMWISHFVNYNDYPDSLLVVCVFDTDDALASVVSTHKDDYLRTLISEKLAAAGIPIGRLRQQVSFDTEQACNKQHEGKWHLRFR